MSFLYFKWPKFENIFNVHRTDIKIGAILNLNNQWYVLKKDDPSEVEEESFKTKEDAANFLNNRQ
jgi:hypothetical protein